jgi:predicted amidohydrolase YtcJ
MGNSTLTRPAIATLRKLRKGKPPSLRSAASEAQYYIVFVYVFKQEVASTPKGQWIVGANFDNLLQRGDFTRNELDEISSDHPILIWYINLHDACVNTEAFKIAGIGEDVGELPGGGHFGRAQDSKLNGMVYEESAMLKFAVHFLGKITPEIRREGCHALPAAYGLCRQHAAARARHHSLGMDRTVR